MTTQYRIASESQEQQALVKWIKLQPKFNGLLIKLNNEGKRSPLQGHMLKLLGMEPGASDLLLAYPTIRHHGLFIEMKRNKIYTKSERKSDTWMRQEAFIENMKCVGYDGHMCFGWEDAKDKILRYIG
jgi:hypothetical protein